jgi:hypothetical protein
MQSHATAPLALALKPTRIRQLGDLIAKQHRRVSARAHAWVSNAARLLLDDLKDAINTGRPTGAEKVD